MAKTITVRLDDKTHELIRKAADGEGPIMQQIVAIGGISQFTSAPAKKIYEYILRLSAKPRPNICFIPTASGESRDRIIEFYDSFTSLSCNPTWLSLFNLPSADLSSFLLNSDVIFVGGGNTRSMLALWREWEIVEILRKALEIGIVLCGSSAGANCWFEQCTTDSVPGDLTVLPCLGLLQGSFTPHYDVEPKRKPTLHRMLSNGQIGPGYAADNDVALHFVNGEVKRTVSICKGAAAYRISAEDGQVIESAMEATVL